MKRWFSKARLVVRYLLRASWAVIAPPVRALLAPIGFRELLLFGGCVLIGYGLYPVYPPAAFVAPGAILAYLALFGTP